MQRDFVIQLRPDSDVFAGQFDGRVEHIASGRSAHFRGVQDLLAFMAHSLAPEVACSEETAGSTDNLTSP
jgi:hypothetical protein